MAKDLRRRLSDRLGCSLSSFLPDFDVFCGIPEVNIRNRFRALVALQQARVTHLCAAWLVVLTALPFTAPFAILDAGDLFGEGFAHTSATTVAASPASTSAQDSDADD